MSFRKPFRAVPIKEGQAYRRQRQRQEWRSLAKTGVAWSLIAILIGGLIGYLSGIGSDGQTRGLALISNVKSGEAVRRLNEAIPAYYAYCDQARAAGKAPLYRGEPGYRPELDADDDGIACEPYPR